MAALSFRHSTSSGHTMSVFQHVWPTGFAVAGSMVWNYLPDNLWDPDVTIDNFKRLLKTFLFSIYQCNWRIRCVTTMHSTNLHFTYFYLLTYALHHWIVMLGVCFAVGSGIHSIIFLVAYLYTSV